MDAEHSCIETDNLNNKMLAFKILNIAIANMANGNTCRYSVDSHFVPSSSFKSQHLHQSEKCKNSSKKLKARDTRFGKYKRQERKRKQGRAVMSWRVEGVGKRWTWPLNAGLWAWPWHFSTAFACLGDPATVVTKCPCHLCCLGLSWLCLLVPVL